MSVSARPVVPVGDALPGRHPLDQRDARGQRHRRAQRALPDRAARAGPARRRRCPARTRSKCRSGRVRVAAELARCRIGAQAAVDAPPATPRSSRAAWTSSIGWSGMSACARCDHTATTSHAPVGRGLRGVVEQVRPVGGRGAVAAQPGVDLEVHAGRGGRPGARRPARRPGARARRRTRSIPGGDGGREVLVRQVQPRQHGRVDARGAQLERLVERADARARWHPASSAARATGTAPCPYPSALTTAISAAPGAAAASTSTLCRTAARSTTASARAAAPRTGRIGHAPILPSAPASLTGRRSRRARHTRLPGIVGRTRVSRARTDRIAAGIAAWIADDGAGAPSAASSAARACTNAPQPGRPPRLQPGGQQRADDPGQHVAGARRGRPRRRRRVHERPAVRVGDDRGVALEQHRHPAAPPRPAGRPRSGPGPPRPRPGRTPGRAG